MIHSHRNLPHWEQVDGTYFVTFRLADAVARETREAWETLREAWRKQHPPPWDGAMFDRYREEVSERMERLLDAGYGSCLLARSDALTLMRDKLCHFQRERYHMDSFVVMPNHIHALFALIQPNSLASVLHSWKSFSSHRLVRHPGGNPPIWLDERFDHVVRNEEAFLKYRQYILENPAKARLSNGYLTWQADEVTKG